MTHSDGSARRLSLDASTLPLVRIASPANAALARWLREATDRPTGRLWARRRVRVESQRCHPDLLERLHALVHQLPDTTLRFVGGIPLVGHPGGVVFAMAAGQSWVMLRLPPHVHSVVVHSEWGNRGLTGDWVDVDPWLTDVEPHEALSRVRGWARAAYEYAGELAPPPRGTPRMPRRG